jgi:predicted metalloprotease
MAQFVSVVLADTEDTWHDWFRQRGQTYVEPTLVLYSNAVESACGDARSAVGPFYCPRDQKVYIDLLLWQWQED